MRDRLAVLDRALIAGRPSNTPAAAAATPTATPVAPVAPVVPVTTVTTQGVRREPLRLAHRVERAFTALWWLIADGVLLGLATLLRAVRPARTMAVGAPVACVAVGVGIALWWGAWAYAVIGVLAAVCFVWIGRSEESSGP